MTTTEEPAWLAADRTRAVEALSRDAGDQTEDLNGHLLGLRPVADVSAEVDAAPPPEWLFSPVWPGEAHGVLAATWKAGKTWTVLDAAVSVASGTPWLGVFDVGMQGPVVMFLGEGGARKMTRRGRAVAAARVLNWDDLPILMAERVPRLRDETQINALAVELARHPAALVIIDPLYLAAAGANSSALYEMGAILEPVQVACQRTGTALMLAHHTNRDSSRKGSERMSGAGPAEWGRVLMSIDVESKTEDTTTGRTDVVLSLTFLGDEITGGKYLVKRSVWADDQADLGSTLNYRVEPIEDPDNRVATPAWNGPTECMAALTAYFTNNEPDAELSKNRVAESLRALGLSYRSMIVGDALERLALAGVLDVRQGPRNARMFRLHRNEEAPLDRF